MLEIGQQNDKWAFHIIDLFIQHNITKFWIAPGSRSTPLTLAIASHKKAHTTIHFDERGLAFHALGYSKLHKEPVVIVVTSGSAVGNLLPAIMEADQSQLPLLILTADRPPELRDCFANQSIDQVKIFQNFTRWQADIPCPTSSITLNYIKSLISFAVEKTRSGPVHLNCQFREPLFNNQNTYPSIPKAAYVSADHVLHDKDLLKIADTFSKEKKGLIILGNLPADQVKDVYTFASTINWPIYADITSQSRCFEKHELELCQMPNLLKIDSSLFEKVHNVIQFGDRIVSKAVNNWIKKAKLHNYFLVSSTGKRVDEFQLVSCRVSCSPTQFCRQLSPLLPTSNQADWVSELQEANNKIAQQIRIEIDQFANLTEPYIHHHLGKNFPTNTSLFLGNSMPIRDAHAFFFSKNKPVSIQTSRGVSGIDGNIAMIFGLANALHSPIISIIGDLTFLHDLNSLAFAKSAKYPVTFFVLNNDGGEIFSHLPISSNKEYFETFFITSHGLTFQKAAELFGISYQCIEDKKSYLEFLSNNPMNSTQIIEFKTSRVDNLAHHKQIFKACECLLLKNKETLENSHLSSFTGF
ncbi:MAG: 2-succinyl-5-enolpyruvyl-6-hydroxy-3-cyclohexene-1-carboxylic-acid synthase [Chlamydiota bacterium]|jgi:2-succinyl-5-enolpyruvyl-6-hydroxy-3-cyclohexene-1-carboxylate synthase